MHAVQVSLSLSSGFEPKLLAASSSLALLQTTVVRSLVYLHLLYSSSVGVAKKAEKMIFFFAQT